MSAIDVPLNQNLVGGMMIRAKDCITVTAANAIMTFHKVKRTLIRSLVNIGTIAAKHHKITVVAVEPSVFSGVAQMFGHSVSESDVFKRHLAEEFYEGEGGDEEGNKEGKPQMFTLMQESGYDYTREGEVMLAIAALEEKIKKVSEREEAEKKKEPAPSTSEASAADQKTSLTKQFKDLFRSLMFLMTIEAEPLTKLALRPWTYRPKLEPNPEI